MSTVQPVVQPDVLGAVYDAILEFAQPAISAENIFRGFQNRVSLPASHDNAVISIISTDRNGTNLQRLVFDPLSDSSDLVTEEQVTVDVQIDFYGENAHPRASAIEMYSRTPQLCTFLEARGVSPLFASQPKDLSALDTTKQFIPRYMLTLSLCYQATSTILESGWFNTATITTKESQ